MREEYDFSNARPNPYAKKLKNQVTINLDADIITYFKQQAALQRDSLPNADQPVSGGLRAE